MLIKDRWSLVTAFTVFLSFRFSEPTFQFCFENWTNDVTYSPTSRTYPIIIKIQANVPIPGTARLQNQIHTTLVSVEPGVNRYKPVILKQRLTIDTLTFLLQEIYGLNKPGDEEADTVSLSSQNTSSSIQLEPGEECIVCLADAKDTLILPCRHLSTCAHCASSLKFQSKKCPICRREFTALLRIRPLTKSPHPRAPSSNSPPPQAGTFAAEGYQHVSLFQAVHGISRSDKDTPHAPGATPSAPIRTSLLREDPILSPIPYPAATCTNTCNQEGETVTVTEL